jgi:dihydrodipicolinate synthase/N-acetylneuraminate lyase
LTDYRPILERIKGPLVPSMPAFTADDDLDIESTCRWVDWLIECGVKLLWTTQGSSHYVWLSDVEVRELTRAVGQVTKSRAVFIASSAYHWSTRERIAFVEYAARCGADVVKLQIDWSRNPNEDVVFDHSRERGAFLPL